MPISMSDIKRSPDNAGKIPRLLAKLGLIADLKRIGVILMVCLALGLNANAIVSNNGIYSQPAIDKQSEVAPNRQWEPAPGIDMRSAHELSSKGEALLVDVRSDYSYRQEHAARAVNFPDYLLAAGPETEQYIDFEATVPKDTHLIVYCSSRQCGQAGGAAEQLTRLGYANVSQLTGGLEEWTETGLPTEKGEQTASADEEKK